MGTVIEPYKKRNSEENVSTSGRVYTVEEYHRMLEAGTWTGGMVEGLGYVMAEVVVYGSASGSDISDFEDSWEDPLGSEDNPFDDDESIDHDNDENGNHSMQQETQGNGKSNNGENSGSGGPGMEHTTITPLSRAKSLIDAFANYYDGSDACYSKIDKSTYAIILANQIKNPSIIKQGALGTCGAAIICRYLAEFMPDKYVEAAISLYKTGQYDKWGLSVADSSKAGTDAITSKIGLSTVDAIMQGAIVNSLNMSWFTYDPFQDGSGLRSFTWPNSVSSFFNDKLNLTVKVEHYITDNYLKSIDYNKNFVIAIVNTDSHGEQLDLLFHCNITKLGFHYVQITGIRNEGGVTIWTWGSNNYYSSSTKIFQLIIVPK